MLCFTREPAGRGPAALGGISGQFGRLARLELAPLRASLPLLLGSAGYPGHVRISVTEDKRASTDTHDVLWPKFRTGAGAHSPSSSGPSKSRGRAQSQSERASETDEAKDLATRRDALESLMQCHTFDAVAVALVQTSAMTPSYPDSAFIFGF